MDSPLGFVGIRCMVTRLFVAGCRSQEKQV